MWFATSVQVDYCTSAATHMKMSTVCLILLTYKKIPQGTLSDNGMCKINRFSRGLFQFYSPWWNSLPNLALRYAFSYWKMCLWQLY